MKYAVYHLPDDIIYHIGKFVRPVDMIWFSKRKYLTYHNLLTNEEFMINNCKNYSYLRLIIRNDYYFVLSQVLRDHGLTWVRKVKRVVYETCVFSTFIEFLIYLTEKYESARSHNTIIIFLKKNKLYVNRHKKTKRRNIKWRA